jgi:hypothetical protein
MIRFALKCACGHRFDSWFRDNRAFEELSAARRLSCPLCGGDAVEKAPMAPHVSTAPRESPRDEEAPNPSAMLRETLLRLRHAVEGSCENVGSAFAEEARKIHYGEAAPRGIYGDATDEEAAALAEEDVVFARLPWISRGDT